MKAKELAEKLLKMPDAIVVVPSTDFSLRHALVEVKKLRAVRGDLTRQTFPGGADCRDTKAVAVKELENGGQIFIHLAEC